GRGRHDPGRVRGALLDPRAAAHLFAAAAAVGQPQDHGRACQRRHREDAGLALFLDRDAPGPSGLAAILPDLGRERMKPDGRIKLVSELLDLPLIDSEGKYCGIVDDVELTGKAAELTALLVGPGAYAGRLPG